MSTNLQSEKTKQARINKQIHKELKVLAADRETTITQLINEACKKTYKLSIYWKK